jgi:glycosyltransferase involved in cell wall biosynthesis
MRSGNLGHKLQNRGVLGKMKILHVSPFYPPNIGGAEACVYYLAKEEARLGHDVSVVTSSLPLQDRRAFVFTRDLFELSDVKVRKLGGFIFRIVPINLKLIPYLCKENFDIIHLHILGFAYQPEVTALISALKGIPLISHIHTNPAGGLMWLKPYLHFTSRIVFKRSKAIIVPTERFKSLILGQYQNHKKISVIPNGVDISLFREIKRGKNRNILFVGRISPSKGLEELISAMKGVLGVVPDAELTVVGPPSPSEIGYWKQLVRMVSELDLNTHVKFLGGLSREVLPEVYNQASVFVCPSRNESFGIVLIEAMAAGVPIVASNIPEFKEIAGSCALLTEPSSKNLSTAIIRVLLDEKLQDKMITSGIKRAQDFSWKNIAHQFLSLYKED